jgi:hypothetical protein
MLRRGAFYYDALFPGRRSAVMEAERTYSGRPFYREHDLIPIPEDIPALGVEKGGRGLIRDLALRNDRVVALVKIDYSTGQTRGWVEMNVVPEQRILSYSLAD